MKEVTIKKELRALRKDMESKIDLEISKVTLNQIGIRMWSLTAYDENSDYILGVVFNFEKWTVEIETRIHEVEKYDMVYLSHACKWVLKTINGMFDDYIYYFTIPKTTQNEEPEQEQEQETEPEQSTNKFYGYGGVHKSFEKLEEVGVTMYTELYNLGLYPDNNGVEVGGFKYTVSVNMLESINNEHTVEIINRNKYISRIKDVRVIITPTLQNALADYLKFKCEQKKGQEIIVNTLEHDIKIDYNVDENDRFRGYGFVMEFMKPNTLKVVNLDVWLVKKGMKYYVSGRYNDGTQFKASCYELEKAIKTLCDYAARTRP